MKMQKCLNAFFLPLDRSAKPRLDDRSLRRWGESSTGSLLEECGMNPRFEDIVGRMSVRYLGLSSMD